jgi:hypothetical protein
LIVGTYTVRGVYPRNACSVTKANAQHTKIVTGIDMIQYSTGNTKNVA